MVLGSITKYLIFGLIAAFAITSLAQPSRAYAATQVFGGVGSSLSSLGTGIQDFLTGTGTGFSKLFNPLFTLRDLIYGPAAGQQAALDVREETTTGNIETSQQAIEASTVLQLQPETLIDPTYQSKYLSPPPFQFSIIEGFGAAPVASSVVHGQTLPLTQEAIDYYQARGVSVSPANSQTVASRNSATASAPSSQVKSQSYRQSSAVAHGPSTSPPPSTHITGGPGPGKWGPGPGQTTSKPTTTSVGTRGVSRYSRGPGH